MSPGPSGTLPPKNRHDHIVPQGFLRGFLAPSQHPRSGRVQVYELPAGPWQERTTDEICHKLGYYDYSDPASADATADDAFHDLENKITTIRESIRAGQYIKWDGHRDTLVTFFQMLRARSELFRAQVVAEQRRAGSFLRVREWISETTFRFEENKWEDSPGAEDLLKNKSITDARTQIAKGPGEWGTLSWTLGFTDLDTPFVTSDVPVVLSGTSTDWDLALSTRTFWIAVPFGWDMCLLGTPAAQAGPSSRRFSRQEVIAVNSSPLSAARVVISAIRLPWLPRRLKKIERAVPMAPI